VTSVKRYIKNIITKRYIKNIIAKLDVDQADFFKNNIEGATKYLLSMLKELQL
jgi:hypothetical protein